MRFKQDVVTRALSVAQIFSQGHIPSISKTVKSKSEYRQKILIAAIQEFLGFDCEVGDTKAFLAKMSSFAQSLESGLEPQQLSMDTEE